MKTFNLRVYNRYDITFRLAVCKTRKEMVAAIIKDQPDANYHDRPDANTMGMFCPTFQKIEPGVPGLLFSNVFGTMYLNLADLSDEIIVHECAHAAFSWEFNIRHYTGSFDDDDFDEQESFCYFIGRAVEKVKKTIKEHYRTGGRVK